MWVRGGTRRGNDSVDARQWWHGCVEVATQGEAWRVALPLLAPPLGLPSSGATLLTLPGALTALFSTSFSPPTFAFAFAVDGTNALLPAVHASDNASASSPFS